MAFYDCANDNAGVGKGRQSVVFVVPAAVRQPKLRPHPGEGVFRSKPPAIVDVYLHVATFEERFGLKYGEWIVDMLVMTMSTSTLCEGRGETYIYIHIFFL